jgi:hypothetical protein
MAYADGSEVGKWGVGLNGGFNTHSMSDFNTLSAADWNGAAISTGEQAGIDVKYRIVENWLAGIEGNYLFVGNSTSQGGGETTKANLDATEILLDGSYIFPSVAQGLDLRIGVAVGMLMLTGADIATTGDYYSGTTDLSGSGFDGKVFIGGDYYFNPSLSLGLDLGYRYAAASPITAKGGGSSSTWQNSAGKDQSVDYSGFNSQLELTWWIQ